MGQKWFYSENGRATGPFSFDQLKWLIANKRLSPDDLVWSEGMPNWARAAEVVGLFTTDQAIRIKPPPLPKSASGSREAADRTQQQEPKASVSQSPLTPIKPVSRPAASAPSSSKGTVVVCRKPKLTGFFYTVKVSADGQSVGEIPGGLLDLLAGRERELEFHLPAGAHSIEVTGGGLKGSATVNVPADQDISLLTHFSNLGAIGGGLVIAEEGAKGQVSNSATDQGDTSPSTPGQSKVGLSRRTLWITGTSVAALVSMCLCCGIGFMFHSDSASMKTTDSAKTVSDDEDWVWQLQSHRESYGTPTVWTHPTRRNIKVLYWRVTFHFYDAIATVEAIDGSGEVVVLGGALGLDRPGLEQFLRKIGNSVQ